MATDNFFNNLDFLLAALFLCKTPFCEALSREEIASLIFSFVASELGSFSINSFADLTIVLAVEAIGLL